MPSPPHEQPTHDHPPEAPPEQSLEQPAEQRYRGPDRRQNVVDMRRPGTGLERRRGPGRRRSDFAKAAEEGEMSPEQFLFIKAIDAYKRVNNKPYPTWTEILEVIRKLGYRKTCPTILRLDAAEDWLEAPDSPAFLNANAYSDEAA